MIDGDVFDARRTLFVGGTSLDDELVVRSVHELIQSPEFRTELSRATGIPASEFTLRVGHSAGSSILNVSVRHRDAEVAHTLSDAVPPTLDRVVAGQPEERPASAALIRDLYDRPIVERVDPDADVEDRDPWAGWDDTRLTHQDQIETPLTIAEIETLDDVGLDTRVWLRATTYADASDPEGLERLDPGVRAYLATRLFEWEIGNGGLHEYLFNYPSPDLLRAVLDGFTLLDLHDVRELVERTILPVADREAEWRNALRDGTIDTFLDSYPETDLSEFDNQIGEHDNVRIAYIRANPALFAR